MLYLHDTDSSDNGDIVTSAGKSLRGMVNIPFRHVWWIIMKMFCFPIYYIFIVTHPNGSGRPSTLSSEGLPSKLCCWFLLFFKFLYCLLKLSIEVCLQKTAVQIKQTCNNHASFILSVKGALTSLVLQSDLSPHITPHLEEVKTNVGKKTIDHCDPIMANASLWCVDIWDFL